MSEEDEFVRIRKLLARKHIDTGRKIKQLSAKFIQFGMRDIEDDLHRKEGEKLGLCYALKVIDKICQTEMTL